MIKFYELKIFFELFNEFIPSNLVNFIMFPGVTCSGWKSPNEFVDRSRILERFE